MTFKSELFGLLFPLFFVAVWAFVGFLISRMGWHGFARKYATKIRPPGDSFNCPTAHFGSIFASYRNVMRVVFSEPGIYFYPMFLFRAFHRPFLVPWDKVVGLTKVSGFLGERGELEVRDGTREIHLVLRAAAIREFERYKKV